MIKRIVIAVILKMLVFLGLVTYLPEGYSYNGSIETLALASFVLVVIFSIIMPLVHKMTFLIKILTLGGAAVVVRLISMALVLFILNAIGFSAANIGYYLLVALIFTIV